MATSGISLCEAVPNGPLCDAHISFLQQFISLFAVWDEPRQQKEHKGR